ncbi:hypothetical protein SAMN05444414_1303 [Roseovarius marisflavi]|uniref:Uncharacterized protein n=2 Tax=Roseovarius marisflavi TaxID=1054996 RepID=A0A1M7CSH9_9RHOB|nr:hypothetical protein SAMN05444414_1303 [Roseovarius marisflavi]
MQVKSITNATMTYRSPATVTLDWHPLPSRPKIGKFNEPSEEP